MNARWSRWNGVCFGQKAQAIRPMRRSVPQRPRDLNLRSGKTSQGDIGAFLGKIPRMSYSRGWRFGGNDRVELIAKAIERLAAEG